ncbi:MAG: pyruvate kinase [Candidatus Cloacimonetes bacterium]|nr:pyruvate kinase [Candidatus Cloacimonadota bacterium]
MQPIVDCHKSDSSTTRTKIVCTLTPQRADEATLRQLVEAGMDVVRVNFSHMSVGDADPMLEAIARVRAEMNIPLAVLLDTKGPEVRIFGFAEPVELKRGDRIIIHSYIDDDIEESIAPAEKRFHTNLHNVGKLVEKGARVLLMDGYIEGNVIGREPDAIEVEINNDGCLRPRAHLSLPGVDYPLPFLSQKDAEDIRYAVRAGFDYLALSFVRTAEDIFQVKHLIRETDANSSIRIIAKIESKQAIEHLDAIIQYSDGVMVARGDLGVELDLEDVPIMQKRIIEQCYLSGKPVITATQMLESMIHNRVPNRAEVSDVANACYDLTSAVMLSGETAIGDHPNLVVSTMDRIIRRVESSFDYESMLMRHKEKVQTRDLTTIIGYNAVSTAYQCKASALVVFSKSGYSARMISKLRPHLPILAFTPDEKVYHQLSLNWGVFPRTVPDMIDFEQMVTYALDVAEDEGLVKRGDLVVIVAGLPLGKRGTTNMIRVESVGKNRLPGRVLHGGEVTSSIVHVETDADLEHKGIAGCIVVLGHFEKSFTTSLRYASGIISPNDEFAGDLEVLGMAYSIPVIVGVRNADTLLPEGVTVRIDSENELVIEV